MWEPLDVSSAKMSVNLKVPPIRTKGRPKSPSEVKAIEARRQLTVNATAASERYFVPELVAFVAVLIAGLGVLQFTGKINDIVSLVRLVGISMGITGVMTVFPNGPFIR